MRKKINDILDFFEDFSEALTVTAVAIIVMAVGTIGCFLLAVALMGK